MGIREDELLSRELGKIAQTFGPTRGFDKASIVGGSLGARLASKFLPTEHYQARLHVDADVASVLTKVCSFFSESGRVALDGEVDTSPYPKISGVIGSGMLNMNPTVVHLEVIGSDKTRTDLLITAAAKEGLIKQRTAEKAVNRVVGFLNRAFQ